MIKNTSIISIEDLRRNIGLPPYFTITEVYNDGKNIVIESESPVIAGDSVKKIAGEELTEVLRAINKSIEKGKEIIFSYYNEKRDTVEITSRKFVPMTWINADCIEGFDLEKKDTRRFCPSRMNWIESVI